jgi:hypothetical protein
MNERRLIHDALSQSFVLQAWKGDEARTLPEMPNA